MPGWCPDHRKFSAPFEALTGHQAQEGLGYQGFGPRTRQLQMLLKMICKFNDL
jgi:hypothetical protein